MGEHEEHKNEEDEKKGIEWKSFLFGFFLALLFFLMQDFGGFGSTSLFVNNTQTSPQAAAALLATEALETGAEAVAVIEEVSEGSTTTAEVSVGTTVVRIIPERSAIITVPIEEEEEPEPTGSPSLGGPWHNHWWRGPDQASENDPTPGVPKMYEIPIQGVGGGGSSGGSSGPSGNPGGGGGPGGAPGGAG